MARIVYVNGNYLPEEQGNVSMFDRGFLFADGVYEVTPVVRGKLVDYEAHMERLARSLAEIHITGSATRAELDNMHMGLIHKNCLGERKLTPDEDYCAEEAFLTSASNFVMPITEIDGHRIGGGQPGPVARKLRELILEEAMR